MEKSTEFRQMVETFQSQYGEYALPQYRAEGIVESLKDWSLFHSLDDMANWFEQARKNCPIQVDDISLKDVRGWSSDPETGNLSHESGEFFVIHGVRTSNAEQREVGGGWDQPILTQVGYDGGILGLLRKKFDGIPHYLIEAKAEPGNYELLQMSPTLQATFSNLKKAHGGRKPHFAELFEHPKDHGVNVLYEAWLSEDGGRLHKKRNYGMLVEVGDDHDIELPEGFRWISLYQIKALLHRDAWVNPHIRGIIAHM